MVTKCLGNAMYKVQLEEQADVIWRRHAKQLYTTGIIATVRRKILTGENIDEFPAIRQ